MSIAALNWAWAMECPNATSKLVLLALADRADDDGKCWPGMDTVAARAGISTRQVSTHMKSLEGMGLLSRVRRRRDDGTLSGYTFRLHVQQQQFDPPEANRQWKQTSTGSASPPPEVERSHHRKSTSGQEPSVEPPVVQKRPMPDGTDPTADAEVVPITTDPPDVSEDATTLAREFAGMVAANGHPLPSKGSKAAHSWLIEADRLLRHGPPGQTTVPPPDLDRAIAVARWATSDIDFWAANVRSMPKFRKQWSQLALQANRTRGRPDADAVADQYAKAAEALRAQGR